MADVFISYSRLDEEFVGRLVGALEERGKDVWRDKDDIPPAIEWRKEIEQGIDGSHVFTFVLSPESLSSAPCADELARAVETGKTIVPLVRRVPDGAPVPDELARLNYIYAGEHDDFAQAVELLLASIDGLPAWERAHTRLLTRASEWDAKGRDRSLLLRGSDLHEAEQWSTERPQERQPTPLQLSYLLASRRGATRRLRTLVAAALAALLATGLLAIVALVQRSEANRQRVEATRQRDEAVRQANLAESRALAAEAAAVTDRRLDLAALVALEAYRTAPTAEARSALVTTLERADRVAAILPGRHEVVGVGGRGERVATVTSDGTVLLWNLQGRRVGPPIRTRDGIAAVAVAPDGRTVATSAYGGELVFWDAAGATRLAANGALFESLDALAFDDAGTTLASLPPRGIALWAAARPVRPRLLAPGRLLWDLALGPGGRIAAGAGDDGRVHLWRTRDGRALPPLPHGATLSSVAFSPSGRLLASGSGDLNRFPGTVKVWDLSRRRASPAAAARGPVDGLAFADERTLIVLDGREIATLDLWRRVPRLRPVSPYAGRLLSLVAARPRSFVTLADDGRVRVWSLDPPAALRRRVEAARGVRGVAVSADGRTVAALRGDGSVSVWAGSGRRRAGAPIPSRGVELTAVAFAGSRIVVTGGRDGLVRFTDLDRPRPPARRSRGFPPTDVAVNALAAGADGRWAASSSGMEGTITIWNVATRRRSGDLPVGGGALAFAPDGRTLAAVTGQPGQRPSLGLWDVRTRRRAGAPLGAADNFTAALAFAADGRLLASGAGDRVRLWDVPGRRPSGEPLAIGGEVTSLSFSADGRTLAVAAGAGVSLWDVRTRRRLGDPLSTDAATAIAFGADGRTLVSAGPALSFWSPVLWSVDPAAFRARLCAVANRQLTPAEWRELLPGKPYRKTC